MDLTRRQEMKRKAWLSLGVIGQFDVFDLGFKIHLKFVKNEILRVFSWIC